MGENVVFQDRININGVRALFYFSRDCRRSSYVKPSGTDDPRLLMLSLHKPLSFPFSERFGSLVSDLGVSFFSI